MRKYLTPLIVILLIIFLYLLPVFSKSIFQPLEYQNRKMTSKITKDKVKISLRKKKEYSQSKIKKELQIKNISSISVSHLGYIYALGIKERYIQMFNSENGKYIKTVKVKGRGYSLFLTVKADGHVFIADGNANIVWEYDQNLNEIGSIRLSIPEKNLDFAIDQKGFYYLCFFDAGNMVHKYSQQGAIIASFAIPADVQHLLGSNDAYNKNIIKWSASGSISLDYSGNVFYVNLNPYEIQKYSYDGVLIQKIKRENPFLPPITEYITPLENRRFLIKAFGGAYNILVSMKNKLIITTIARPTFTENGISPKYWDYTLDFFDLNGNYLSTITYEKSDITLASQADNDGFIYILNENEEPKIIKYEIKTK